MSKRYKKKDIFTIPNYLSAFRLCLVPLIIWLYCGVKNNIAVVSAIAVSAVTDILDGKIARKYNMVSDIGKVLDPIADKLTQAALIFCLVTRYRMMMYLVYIFAAKEIAMAVLGYLSVHYSNVVSSAKWYGKACTVVLDLSIAVLVLFGSIPEKAANVIILVCCACLIVSFVLYARFFIKLITQTPDWNSHRKNWMRVYKVAIVILWVGAAVICIINKDKFSVDGVLSYTPKNMVLAVIFMLFLYALKSLSVFIYCGILYIACGVIFPLPMAIIVNILGTAVMVSLPYWMGKRTGSDMVKRITEKHPKTVVLQQMRSDNEFFFTFITHVINILPCDILSLYMGATNVTYYKYLLGSVLGMLPSIVTFPIMGMSITNPSSPQFIISASVVAAITVISIVGYAIYHKKKKNKMKAQSENANG